jgi:ADP-heptose:LPS heptosyltransferase
LFLSKFGFPINDKKIPSLDIKLSSSEIVEGKKSVLNLVNNQKKTICIFTYATGDKCYSETWWEKFYDRLIVEFPDYNIIEILPIENISKINFKAPTFYSKDIREMAGLIANTEVFIGADSGIMHLASAAQTTTVGLFSVSNLSKYQPYSNNSFALDTNTGDLNDWFKELHKIIK